MAGRRINLADLSTAAVLAEPGVSIARPVTRAVPVEQVATNPLNPRADFGDLDDLKSMQTVGQLQACVVVTRAAFLNLYPEHEATIGSCAWVVVAGSRRRAAAEHFGLATLDISVLDHLAATRSMFYGASVTENIDRKDFDVLEEARAVQHLTELSSGVEAGEILGRSKGWVSQRLALLKLSPPMQALLRAGELPIRDARRLAGLPGDEQLPAWEREQEDAAREAAGRFTAVNRPADTPEEQDRAGAAKARIGKVSFARDLSAESIADLLKDQLGAEALQSLVEALTRLLGLPR